jgi:hypothetical protein
MKQEVYVPMNGQNILSTGDAKGHRQCKSPPQHPPTHTHTFFSLQRVHQDATKQQHLGL